MEMSYFDKYGLLHMEKVDPSENGILYLAYLLKLKKNKLKGLRLQTTHLALNNTRWVNNNDFEFWYQANPPQRGQHFSYDNMIGYYYIRKVLGYTTRTQSVFKWNDEIRWHPNSWMWFLSQKNIIWKILFYIPLLLMAVFSRLTNDKKSTSTQLLWFLRGFGYLWSKKRMKFAFYWYVTNAETKDNLDHPLIVESEKYFK